MPPAAHADAPAVESNSPVLRLVVWGKVPDVVAHATDAGGQQILGRSATLRGTVRLVNACKPDAIVVATHTAGDDAFGLMQHVALGHRPLIVLISDRVADALVAFELRAIDCVPPGATPPRWKITLQRMREHRAADRLMLRLTSFCQLLEQPPPAPSTRTLIVVAGGKRVPVATADIECVEAQGNYVSIVTATGQYLHRASLAACARLLRGAGFRQTHRRYLVNPAHVVARTRNRRLVTRSGRQIPCGRLYRSAAADIAAGSRLITRAASHSLASGRHKGYSQSAAGTSA